MMVGLKDTLRAAQDYEQQFSPTVGPIEHHDAEAFFDGLPRWSTEKPDVKLDLIGSYISEVGLTAIIPVIVAVIVILLCFILLIIRVSCLADRVDKSLVRRRKKRGNENIGHLLCSTILVHTILAFLGVGAIGTIVVCESASNISNIVSGLLVELKLSGLAIMDFILWMESRFENFDPESSSFNDGTEEGDFMVLAFTAVVAYVPERFPKVAGFKEELDFFLSSLVGLVDNIGDAVQGIFLGSIGFAFFALIAVSIVFCTGMFTKQRPCFRTLLHLFFLGVPLLASWALFALFTGAGVGIADGCETLADYRLFLSTGVYESTSPNALIEMGSLACPGKSESLDLEEKMEAAAGTVIDNPLASDTLVKMLDIEANDLNETTTWAMSQARGYINCSVLSKFSGKVEKQVCGKWNTSLIAGVKYLWLSNLMISLLLSILFIASIYNSPILWTAAVWPPPPMSEEEYDTYGASKPSEDEEGGRLLAHSGNDQPNVVEAMIANDSG